MKTNLEKKINQKRQEMIKAAQTFGLQSDITIKLSVELDQLLDIIQRQNKNKFSKTRSLK